MKMYDLVKQTLTFNPSLRNSDKRLQWDILEQLGYARDSMISYQMFMAAPSLETIRRCRQKVQETCPELQASNSVRRERAKKAEEKGTFIFREDGQAALI